MASLAVVAGSARLARFERYAVSGLDVLDILAHCTHGIMNRVLRRENSAEERRKQRTAPLTTTAALSCPRTIGSLTIKSPMRPCLR